MFPRFNKFSLAFLTSAMMACGLASLSQAAEFHAATGPNANITGVQTEQLKLQLTAPENSTVQCTQALFEGTVPGQTVGQTKTSELTLTPTITGCQALGQAATVDMNGCKLTITGVGQPAKTTVTDVTGCTAGKQFEVTTPICVMTIPEQTGLSHATGAEVAATPKHIEVQITLQGVTYQEHGALCPGTGGVTTVTTHNADMTGKATFRAFADNGSEVASHNGHQYNKLKCGVQVALFAT